MKFKKILVTMFVSTLLSLSAKTQVPLAHDLYSVDKRIELQLNKFLWADTGTLKNSMTIKVFTDDPAFANPFFNQSLDCYTQSLLKNDTIYITGYMTGQLGWGFKLVLFNDSCIVATFGLSDAKVYKYNNSDAGSTDFILLPSITQNLILSKKPLFQKGEIVSGAIKIKSVPYYYTRFKGKFRIELFAYFKTAPLNELQ